MGSEKNEMKNYSFYIDLQMIVDGLVKAGIPCTLYKDGKQPHLLDIRFLKGQKAFNKEALYIGVMSDVPVDLDWRDKELQAMLLIGETEKIAFGNHISRIVIPGDIGILEVYDVVSEVFYRARRWNAAMQNIINNHGSLEQLCEAAEKYFENPLFIHNPNFYILACHTHYDKMDPWQKDDRTGQMMLTTELINGFKLNPEYLDTLHKVGSQIYPFDSTGYRVMYVNLWDDFGRYQGRICVDEILTAFQPGQMPALEHFGRMVMVLMQQRNAENMPFEKPLEELVTNLIEGRKFDSDYIEGILDMQGWKIRDTYRLFRMQLHSRDHLASSMVNTCNYIEGIIEECRTFQQDDSILVLLNSTKSTQKEDDMFQGLNRIVRETILLTGISNPFDDFTGLAYFYRQASLALEYGLKKEPTIWIHRFENYVMDYCYDMVCRDIPAEYICAPELLNLKAYDEKKHTELYDTLKKYMSCMMNAEQTARELYIHRSTLFYRLKKIREVSGLDLYRQENAFYIQFSINLLEK